jgi:diguanylate cyclase (GGDEF)-like protein
VFSDFNIRTTFIIFVATLLLIGAHKYGLMNTSLDLTDGTHPTIVTVIVEGSATNSAPENEITDVSKQDINATNTPIPFAGKCTKTADDDNYSLCGLSIAIGAGASANMVNLSKGYDLSVFDALELKLAYESPVENNRIKVSLRNYNNAYSKPNDFVSLKFNSITFAPSVEEKTLFIPFNTFQVEDWWIKDKNISFENAQVELNNVAFIEILTDQMNEVGDYQFKVEKLVFHGQLINELQLFQAICLAWLIAIIILVVRQARHLKIISNTDALTGLLNRRGITDWSYKKGRNLQNRRKGYLFYFDIDGFKKVNDTHGHAVGDSLLIEIGRIVEEVVITQPKHLNNVGISRLAGDEFVLIISRISHNAANKLANKIFDRFLAPIVIDNRLLKTGLSMGITAFDPNKDDFEDILSRADSAMYCAKKDHTINFRFFDEHVRDIIYLRKKVAEDIRKAVDNNQFSMAYMPIFRAYDLYIHKVEVLLRCNSPDLEGIGPEQFIPIAEEFGVIQNIDLMVIETTFKHMYLNKSIFENTGTVVCINISAKELNNVNFTDSLAELIKDYRINPKQIELEITETSLIEIDEQSIEILNKIRKMGLSLALDDFGTGYTAFSQIVNYPIDCLKIDKSFIDDLNSTNEVKKTLVKSILAIAKSFNLETVAEGIEKEEQFKILKELGCDSIQGYLLSKPISWLHFKTLLEDQDGHGHGKIISIAN